ncbi:MAG: cysteine desulfurase family protein [Finegoldia sp.]|nr:cysteine desulfurase family protein [Finegoldia sp.]
MIYLDYAATSLKRGDILKYIMENKELFDANPDSVHSMGRRASALLDQARGKLADSICAEPDEIIFTSGASESNNWVLDNFRGDEIVSSKIEHASILNKLDHTDSKITLLNAGQDGLIKVEDIKRAVNDQTKLVTIQYVNNESGAIQPVKEIGEFLKDKDVWFHVDCTQALGHIKIDINEIGCDSASFSGHKLGGLNGFGFLYARKPLENLIYGGEQENKRRGGTSFVAGAFSMSESIEPMYKENESLRELKKLMLENLRVPYEVNGDLKVQSNHILNLYFPFERNDLLMTYLDMNGVCVSAGSACSAGSPEPSYVISNMYDEDRARKSIRFSFGFANKKDDIIKTCDLINDFYERNENG